MTLLVSWVTQRLRVQWCATIPHCAPLERGDWRCRAAIDISLLWSEMRDNLRWVIRRGGEIASPNTLMCCAIVVCSLSQEYCLTLLVSWETQRLRVQWCATIPHCAPLERGDWTCRAAINISLLWSERRDNLRWVIHRRGLVSSPNTLMCCAIVVCSLSQEYCMTLLVSWVTQPLRI